MDIAYIRRGVYALESIEARQHTAETFMDVYQWVERNTAGSFEPMEVIEGRKPCPESGVSIDPRDGRMMIATLEGFHHVSLGDFVIRGVRGEFYPCKPDIFEATYERVPCGAVGPQYRDGKPRPVCTRPQGHSGAHAADDLRTWGNTPPTTATTTETTTNEPEEHRMTREMTLAGDQTRRSSGPQVAWIKAKNNSWIAVEHIVAVIPKSDVECVIKTLLGSFVVSSPADGVIDVLGGRVHTVSVGKP